MACAAQQESKAVGVDGRWFLARIRGLTEQEHLDHSLVWAIEVFLTDHRLSRAHFSPDYYESHNTQETGGCGVRQGTISSGSGTRGNCKLWLKPISSDAELPIGAALATQHPAARTTAKRDLLCSSAPLASILPTCSLSLLSCFYPTPPYYSRGTFLFSR